MKTGEPYTVAEGSQWKWFRSRIVGGRTNHYGRISLRFSDYDFKPYSFDGLGTDWPVSYEEMSPYYDKAEEFEKRIQWLQRYNRPILCTEYMARGNGSTFEGSLPILEQFGIMEILRGMNQGMYHNDHSNMGKNGRR